jgi:F-type H+-transporting ATPase subunit gamma
MANLKEVRQRIVSVSSTQQITSAMKMVSAAKLRRAQDAIIQMRPFANKLREIFENLAGSLSGSDSIYSKERKAEKVLLVVVSSNRGLCGGFNSNVIKLTNRLSNEKYAEQKKAGNVHILAIGKKAADYFRKSQLKLVAAHNELFDKLTYENTAVVAEKIMSQFAGGEYDRVEIIYNQFKNAAVQILVNEQFLPVAAPKGGKKQTHDYIFEPSQEAIVKDLIPKTLKTQLFKAVLDSNAAEHGARMTAMHKATDNAKELLRNLRINYNKARQAAITGEILEIVGGAEALNN